MTEVIQDGFPVPRALKAFTRGSTDKGAWMACLNDCVPNYGQWFLTIWWVYWNTKVSEKSRE